RSRAVSVCAALTPTSFPAARTRCSHSQRAARRQSRNIELLFAWHYHRFINLYGLVGFLTVSRRLVYGVHHFHSFSNGAERRELTVEMLRGRDKNKEVCARAVWLLGAR